LSHRFTPPGNSYFWRTALETQWSGSYQSGSFIGDASESITVYLVGYASQNTGKEMILDNIIVEGQFAPIPEPATITVILLGLPLMRRSMARWRCASRDAAARATRFSGS
jgi:hypothetical protein